MNFKYRRKINYYETDKMGIVHHSNYIRFLEESRGYWMEAFDLSMEEIERQGFTIPTIEVNCKYKNHVTAGDHIIIEPKIEEFNGVRMTVKYDVTEEKTGKTVIEAYTKHCFTDRSLKPVNIKKKNEHIYSKFQSLIEE